MINCLGFTIITWRKRKSLDIATLAANEAIQQENQQLQETRKKFLKDNEELTKKKEFLILTVNQLTDEQQKLQLMLKENEIRNTTLQEQNGILTEQIKAAMRSQQEMAQQALSAYCDSLDLFYVNKEQEYDELIKYLEKAYESRHDQLAADLALCCKELDKIRATRAAALEAQLKEREIKEQRAFYSLPIAEADLSDIKTLEAIKSRLLKPRVLSMLIWQTYFQKPMTQLCNNVLGAATVCGIYKITNQNNNMCYIGQSVDVATRWKDHAKCGLGIDTPQGNKLYAAMIEEGLWNFTFELLEKCTRAELDEKERKYIEIYDAATYGYNILKGNK